MADIQDLRERIATACRVLGRLELTRAALGHVSARVPGTDRILIRARGPGEVGVRYTTEDQVIEVDLDGALVSGDPGLAAPQEVFIHTEVYRARPDVQSVVHIHPPKVVLFTICCKPLLPLYGAFNPGSAGFACEGVPTYERSILINSPALGRDLVAAMGDSPVCLMRGHGITTMGGSIEEACISAIHLNELAEMNYDAHLLGGAQPISEEDQKVLEPIMKPRTRFDGSDGSVSGMTLTLWRYYKRLTDS